MKKKTFLIEPEESSWGVTRCQCADCGCLAVSVAPIDAPWPRECIGCGNVQLFPDNTTYFDRCVIPAGDSL